MNRFRTLGLVRTVSGFFLAAAMVALFLLVADLGEPLHPARVCTEVGMIAAGLALFAWNRT